MERAGSSICWIPLAIERSRSSCLRSIWTLNDSALWSASAACSAIDCISEKSVAVNRRLSTGFATARTPKMRPRNAIGTAMTDRTARFESSCLTIRGSRVASAMSSPRPVSATRPAMPSPTGNSSVLSTCSMNLARVASFPFTWSGSGRWGGNSPSTATLRIVSAAVRSKMQALSAPVQRIEACTIRWCSSWRDRPSPSASAMRCMKSSTRWRSWVACLRCSSRMSDCLSTRYRPRQSAATMTRRHVMMKYGMEGPAGHRRLQGRLNRNP